MTLKRETQEPLFMAHFKGTNLALLWIVFQILTLNLRTVTIAKYNQQKQNRMADPWMPFKRWRGNNQKRWCRRSKVSRWQPLVQRSSCRCAWRIERTSCVCSLERSLTAHQRYISLWSRPNIQVSAQGGERILCVHSLIRRSLTTDCLGQVPDDGPAMVVKYACLDR